MKKTNIIILLVLIVCSCSSPKEKIEADLLIMNGTVYNGVDTIPSNEAIAIKDDKIVFVGNSTDVIINSLKTIDATGMIVSPGFIDPHTHANRDLTKPEESHNMPFMFQGITTVIVGNDGASSYPSSKYFKIYEKNGIGTNLVALVGHGTIRRQVIGRTNRHATDDEIKEMQKLVQQEMDAGAFGISTGLYYSPGSYSSTEEVVALSKIVSENDGIYDTHMRDESSFSIGLINSVKESIEIGRRANIPIHLSHIKCLGVDVWNQSEEVIELVNKAREEGLNITANQYPYEAGATGLYSAVAPRWSQGGGKDSMFIRFKNPKFTKRMLEETKDNIRRRGGAHKLLMVDSKIKNIVGKNLLEISEDLNVTPEEAVFKVLEKGSVRLATFSMIQDDIVNFMKQDWVVTGSDGNTGHPRKYGSFPRKYNKYVKQENVIDIATFINGSSSKTAEILKIPNRGKLKKDYYADVIIFNPETFKDVADYENPFEYAAGLKYSIINGKLAVEKGEFTGQLNGRVLKKNEK